MSNGGCRFEVNDLECKKTIEETIIAWLHETAGEKDLGRIEIKIGK